MSHLIRTRRLVTSTPSPTTTPTTAATAPAEMDHRPVNLVDPVGLLVPQAQASSTSSVALPVSARCNHRCPRTMDQIQVSEQIDVEASRSKKKVIRGAGFNKDVDHVLISAWLNSSMDAIIGNDQKHQTYWQRIEEYYNQNKWFESNQIEEDNIDIEKRPLGNKAAKRKMKEAAKNHSTPISVQNQKLHEEKKERGERKMELIKKKVEHDEQKIRLKRLDFETKIMFMDTSEMGDEERLYYSQLKMKILKR
ncbi:hypothetical protein DVH24_005574 [Malus domestica]|uniref:No apical meristem-associated C-terminal domain-containing protein n=1 Tax=Malus domestica TaxID=3750 RepID=A0A498IPC1_MALDO|nr:hypothetical protein DVH24_005574 [Malus domestica]